MGIWGALFDIAIFQARIGGVSMISTHLGRAFSRRSLFILDLLAFSSNACFSTCYLDIVPNPTNQSAIEAKRKHESLLILHLLQQVKLDSCTQRGQPPPIRVISLHSGSDFLCDQV